MVKEYYMPTKLNCGRCGKFGKVTWANYVPYCDKCLAEKSKNAVSGEDALFPEIKIEREFSNIKKRLIKLEREVKKLKK